MTTYGGTVGPPSTPLRRTTSPAWVSSNVQIGGQLGSANSTAQVEPAAFTTSMMRAAQELGAKLRIATVTGLLRRGDEVVGVDCEEQTLEGDAVVIAMGPWSILATQWLSLAPVLGMKGHGIVLGTVVLIPPEALFLEYVENGDSILSPEVFPRADGTTYVCAISSDPPLPIDPDCVIPDRGAIDRLKALCKIGRAHV